MRLLWGKGTEIGAGSVGATRAAYSEQQAEAKNRFALRAITQFFGQVLSAPRIGAEASNWGQTLAQEPLKSGTLVRYDETTTRWFLALARRAGDDRVELEYLNGQREEVDAERVTPFLQYLRKRQRVFSLKRDDLCFVFYFKTFERLRQDRIDEMQSVLRRHGLRFSPDDWGPEARIQIWPDDSVVASGQPERDAELLALLPRWLEAQRLPPGSRDPLGFQSHAERLANEFLPGLTVFTTRIGYYGFAAWACRELNARTFPAGTVRKELFHRLERALVLCEFVHHGNDNGDCRVIGQRSKSEVLQSAVDDRFRVPARIMKNQESTGVFRLYATSMESNGFAELAPELNAEGLLPLRLSQLGRDLAREFEKRVPEGFFEFAAGDRPVDRDTLREWGRQLCLSSFGKLKYRAPFMEGMLLGNSADAEARYKTVVLLSERGILGESSDISSKSVELMAEDDAVMADDAATAGGISNASVLLDFYEEKPQPEIEHIRIQKASVFELLSLAQTAVFAHAIDALDGAGRCGLAGLRDAAVASGTHGEIWLLPFGQAGSKAQTARDLVSALFEAETAAERAAVGGALMARVVADTAFKERAPDLGGTPVMQLLEALPSEKSLADSYRGLIDAMVQRHESVSRNKNRQRWCYLEGDELVRDDLQRLPIGWHAMRFPQLHALYQDLQLAPEELIHGK